MSGVDVARAVLDELWSLYKVDSNVLYDIYPVCALHGSDAVMVSTGLRLEGLIKDEEAVVNGKVLCSISIKGIARIDSQFIETRIAAVLQAMAGVNSISNVMDILNLDANDYQFAFDLANEMQNRNLVKLLYAFQHGKIVNVEMTLHGVRQKDVVFD
jgi:hypothetical protein